MTTQEVKRKLIAILSADVKGYSRLLGEDELGTIRTLNAHKEVMANLIQQHRGRVVDAPGDNLLAEFGSVVDAVHCAVEIQKELKIKNSELQENRRMEFRIGVNLGDVVEEKDKIFGDGVNIAARLESLSEAGGVCISGKAYDEVKNKLSLGYRYLGEQTVKNIPEPVRVYRVLMEPELAGKVIGDKKIGSRRWQRPVLALVGILILIAAAVAVWQFGIRPSPPALEKADPKKMALPLPDKPSIAVLPFVNMSEDPKQEYLSNGITENIITGLSKMPRLFVIARNSTFTYKDKGVKVQQVAEELGVRYVLEGSVQRSGNRVRITAQLIDALTGNHLWAERYDRDLKDIFAVQDEITMRIMEAMQVKLTEGEQWLRVRPPRNLEAYLKFLQAQEYIQRFNIEGNTLGKRLAEETIVLDPEFAGGYGALASGHMMDVWLGLSKSPKESLDKAVELAQKAISSDPKGSSRTYALLGYLYTMKRDYDKAIAEGEKAVALDPSGADAYAWLGMSLNYADRPKDAIPIFEKAIRLNPFGPTSYFLNFGTSYRMMGQYQEAITQYKKALRIAPDNIIAHIALAATYSLSGSDEEARAEAEEVLRINPKFSVEHFVKTLPFKNQTQVDRYIAALRKAGLSEKPSASLPPSAEVAPKEKVTPSSDKVSKTTAPPAPKVEVASKERMALPLPDKPSIAVLPFVNMSEDPKQEFFVDGMTEEILTALSKCPNLFVIARNSTFTYKGKAVKVKQVSEELGVRYVLEGSVQRSGDRIRVNAQLIDALKGHHLWAERYDRHVKDIFAIQDEITMKIITALQVKLTSGEMIHVLAKGAKNIDAFTKYLQAVDLWTRLTKETNAQAKKLLEEAIALDPEYPGPYIGLAKTYGMDVFLGGTESPAQSIAKAFEFAQKAISLDNTNEAAYSVLSWLYSIKRQYEKAITESERAVSLNPNSAESYMRLGLILAYAGRAEEGIPYMQKALRLNPFPSPNYFSNLAMIYCESGHYEKAIEAAKRALQSEPNSPIPNVTLAISYIRLGREEEARAAGAEILRINPKWSLGGYAKNAPFTQPQVERNIEDLRKAGLK
jgi:adenylate cyclase